MDLNTLCFLLFGVLFIGFFILEGLDYGVGMLLPFTTKTDVERHALIKTIAPTWEGSQVWLIVAGAILLAGFPEVYATFFSGLYLALFLILASLILRGMAIEFHDKDENLAWRSFCYWSIFFGSAIPALVLGIAVACLLHGLPINGNKQYAGDFFDLLSLYSIVGGFTFVLLDLYHGSVYLTMRLDPILAPRFQQLGFTLSKYALTAVVILAVLTFVATSANNIFFVFSLSIMTVTSIVISTRYLVRNEFVSCLAGSSLAIATLVLSIFAGLYPRLMVSSLNPQLSLDIYNSSSNPFTLKIMTTAMLVVLPVVIAFEMWKFHIFLHRITLQEIELALYMPELRRMNKSLKQCITYANCLADAMDEMRKALQCADGAIIKNLKPEHRTLLFGKRHFHRSIFRKNSTKE